MIADRTTSLVLGAASHWRRQWTRCWREQPVFCSLCSARLDGASVGADVSMGWCPQCRRVFLVPLLRIPGWVTGTVGLLIVAIP